jgi:nucleotide-binding universal stress UspA family protein
MKILLTIDASQASQNVLTEAAARPWPAGSSFCVVHVVDLRSWAEVPALLDEAKKAALALVKAGADAVSAAGYKTTGEVLLGYPRSAIADYAKSWGADWVMAGSHGQGAVSRFLLGSVAQGILRAAPCSVEIVRCVTQGLPSSSRAMKILLATDGSECSKAAAMSVAKRPWPPGSEFKVLSVVELIFLENQAAAFPLAAVYPPSLLDELMNNARSRAKDAVESARKILEDAGLKVGADEPAPLGDPRSVILDRAGQWGADLIVLGSHGKRGLDRMLMGSVSENVAIHASCSVEVVRG